MGKEVFNAKISIGSPKVKGHGASHDIRLLEVTSITTKKIWWNLKPIRGLKGAIAKKKWKITTKEN